MRLPAAAAMHRLHRLTEMALWLVDALATHVHLSSTAIARARRARKAAEAEFSRRQHGVRSERAAARAAETRKKKVEEYEGLSAEQKRVRDAAEEKKKAARTKKARK